MTENHINMFVCLIHAVFIFIGIPKLIKNDAHILIILILLH